MYFAYGWPRVLSLGSDAAVNAVAQIAADDDTIIVVTSAGVQLWSGDQHRVRLGSAERSEAAVRTEGANSRAFWSSSRRLLAVVVGNAARRQVIDI